MRARRAAKVVDPVRLGVISTNIAGRGEVGMPLTRPAGSNLVPFVAQGNIAR